MFFCEASEFAGTASAYTIGLVIPSLDSGIKALLDILLRFEMAIDAGKQCGQGCLFVLGAETVTDAKKAVKYALERTDYWQECLYVNHVGHMECHVTANAGQVLHQIFGTPLGKPFGIIGAAPAGIGIVAIDHAVKAAPVDIMWSGTPSHNLLMMNEVSPRLPETRKLSKANCSNTSVLSCRPVVGSLRLIHSSV